jgi:two-component system nitrate/nitrite response regulator NarL
MDAHEVTCVVADDHAVLRKGVVAYLQSYDDLRVIGEANDGAATLAMVERRRPDVLIVDWFMTGIDGIAVCHELHERALPTRVILYSGHVDPELVDLAIEAGASGCVVKAGPADNVVQAVRLAIDGQVYVDPILSAALIARRSVLPKDMLSGREREILTLLAEGSSTDEAAQALFLSPATVRSYAENAMHKLHAHNRPHLVAKSLRLGLLN